MANKNSVASKIGLMLLGLGTSASIFSVLNPSLFTLRTFAASPVARARAREGIFIGLGLGALTTLGIALAFPKNPLAAVATGAGFVAFGTLALLALEPDGNDKIDMKEQVEPTEKKSPGISGNIQLIRRGKVLKAYAVS